MTSWCIVCLRRASTESEWTTLSLLSGTQAPPHKAISPATTSVVDICRNGCDLCEQCAVLQNRTFIESDLIEQQVPTQHTVRNHNVALEAQSKEERPMRHQIHRKKARCLRVTGRRRGSRTMLASRKMQMRCSVRLLCLSRIFAAKRKATALHLKTQFISCCTKQTAFISPVINETAKCFNCIPSIKV